MNTGIRTAAYVTSLVVVQLCTQLALAQDKSTDDDDQVIDAITVFGTQSNLASASAEAALTPGGVELIDMDEFRERNVSSLADVLRHAPGIWSTSDNGSEAIFFSSRGSNLDSTDYDMNGIKLLQDGLSVTSADGNNHNRIIDPLSARHAVVARGANAMKYGASTLGGAINFESVTARDGTGADLSLNGGSFGQLQTRLTFADTFDNGLDGLLTIEARQWDGYREHNEQERLGLYANAGWQISPDVATRVYATWIDNDQELPGGLTRAQMLADPEQAAASAVSGHFQVDVETWRLASKTSWQIDERQRLDVGFSVEEQSLFHPIVDRVMVDFDGPGPAEPVEVFSLLIATEQRDHGTALRYNYTGDRHDIVAGVNYARSSVEGGNYRNLGGQINGLSTVVDNSATLLEAFVMDRWKLSEQLTLVLAAQAVSADREVRNTDVASAVLTNPQDSYDGINPRIGIVYTVSDGVSLYANVSRLFEPPTNYQLQDNVSGGDATLKAMKGAAVEVGTRGTREFGSDDRWNWDVSIYHATIDDEILSVEDPAAPGTSLATNIDKTLHSGLEAMVAGEFGLGESGRHYLAPLFSLTVNEFSFEGDAVYGDNQLPAAPDYVLRGEMMYRNDRGFQVGPTFERVGKRYADFANTYTIDSYALMGLRAAWSGERFSVNATVNNVFDENYVANHSVRNIAAESDAILNPGTPVSAYVGVRWLLR